MLGIEITSALLVALTIGLVQVIKKFIDEKYIPLSSVLIGVILTFLATQELTTATAITGIVIGLSSCGFYDNLKAPLTK